MFIPARRKHRSGKVDEGKRSPAHRKWISDHHCSVAGCSNENVECAHVRRAWNSGTSMKPSDAFTVPLCKSHHNEQHTGDQTFEAKHGLDLLALARTLYLRSPHRQKLDNPYG